jgi:hypothetical protein
MNAYAALETINRLETTILKLTNLKDSVNSYNIYQYKDAGNGKWYGQVRNMFKENYDYAQIQYNQIYYDIDIMIEECQNKQRALAYTIDVVEYPEVWEQAKVITSA